MFRTVLIWKGPDKPQSVHPAQTASVLAPFLSRREQLLDRDSAVSLPKSAHIRNSFVDFFLPAVHFGDDSCYGATMPRDNECLAALHVVGQLKQMGFGFGSLNLTHGHA
jgi:hypothetical protein